MFEEKFGFMPKKNVKYDGENIYIGKEKFSVKYDVRCIFVRPFNLAKNEWGSVYLSKDGEDYNNLDLGAKNVFKYTKKQTDNVSELLNMLDVEIIEKNNDLNQIPTTSKPQKQEFKKNQCPNCGSTSIQFMENNKKNFSVGKAVAGSVLTGGVGTLAGFAGKKGKTDKWFCSECGSVFDLDTK